MNNQNALDAQVAFTWFERHDQPTGIRGEINLSGLAGWITSEAPVAAAKHDLPLIKLATFTGNYRNDANLEAIHGIEADYDGENMPPDIAAYQLQQAGIAAIIYTTPSHRSHAPRWRALCPTSRSLQPSDRHILVSRVNGALNGILARESWTAPQAFYVGAVAGGEPVQVWRVKGQPIDLVGHIAPNGPPQSTSTREPLGTLPTVAIDYVRAALDEIDPNELSHGEWIKVTAAYRGAGGDRDHWDRWCARYNLGTTGEGGRLRINDPADNAKQWRSLDGGTALGWSYLASKAPLAAAVPRFGTQPHSQSGGTVQAVQYELPVGCATTGAPSHLDVVTQCRDWSVPVGYDTFAERLVVTGPLPGDRRGDDFPRALLKRDYTMIRIAFNAIGVKPSTEAIRDGVDFWASMNAFNPVTDWLNGLTWDGVARLDDWLITYLGADQPDWCRIAGPRFVIGMVARAMQPGCKMDNALVLEGPQGTGKSTAANVLAGEGYFADRLPNIHDKEALLHIQGMWVVEISELAAIKKSEVEEIKGFLSSKTDRFRTPYDTQPHDHPRRTVFIATTNETTYLKDPTGDRRWWPVRCATIDIDALQRDRAQLFAEATHRYQAGERWDLTHDENRIATREQNKRRKVSEWFGSISAFCEGCDSGGIKQITMHQIFTHLNLSTSELNNPRYTGSIAGDLALLGWERCREANQRYYVKNDAG